MMLMRVLVILCVATLLVRSSVANELVRFGVGQHTFEMEFVEVGDPGNQDDVATEPEATIPLEKGSVDYVYHIGKYEVPCGAFAVAGELGLTEYAPSRFDCAVYADHPLGDHSWERAAEFVNWMNSVSGYPSAYSLGDLVMSEWSSDDPGYDPTNPIRNSLAKYVLPTTDEFHKAAYYDPVKDIYYDYATGSNFAPRNVRGGTEPDTAVLFVGFNGLPAPVNSAGGLSPYGTMGQTGNFAEWEEGPYMPGDLTRQAYRRGLYHSGAQTADASRRRTVTTVPVGIRVVMLGTERPELPADFDGDGSVDFQDFVMFSAHFGQQYQFWQGGDADLNGITDFSDFLVLNANFGRTASVDQMSVPEPDGVALYIAALVLGISNSRRSRKRDGSKGTHHCV